MSVPSAQPVPDPRAWFAPPPAIRKVRRAMSVAMFNGVTLLLGALVSLGIGVFDRESLLLGVLLAGVTFGEFRGRALLERLDVRGPRWLTLNQLILAGLAIAYFSWKAYSSSGVAALSPELRHTGDAEVDRMVADIAASMQPLVRGAYLVIGVVTALFCVLNAWYYATRSKWVAEALTLRPPARTPGEADRPTMHAA